jgi:asparagine synthase (glutamine-hydrolysing)
MCGIAGIISKDTSIVTQHRLKAMTDVIEHRGPDGEGQWISPDGKVGLGHRRLSIIDLSHEADQPMHYMGRYSIVFNGEIYNYIELKETLLKQGYTFKTASDTEVLMALFDRDRQNCLQLLDGMFSFVIYDAKENSIFCARDRFGEKPFFYTYEKGKSFYYGSEMKCLWAGGIPKEVNNRMMFNYLAYGFLDNPTDASETFYLGCNRLPHSHYLMFNLDSFELSIHRYFDINWHKTDRSITVEQAKTKFNDLFYTSVQRRLRSDVPVGSSLSGGLDSSLVVCVIDELKKGTAQKQNTFSAVFPGFKKDERKYMDYVIAKTNVEPHFITPNDESMIAELDKLSWHQEEPFGSASIYVQYCVMKLAKENNVTVLLDGQGADEILAGYHPYYTHFFNELKRTNKELYAKEMQAYNGLHAGSTINDSVVSGWKNIIKSLLPDAATSLRKAYQQYKQFREPLFNKEFYHEFYKESFHRYYNFETLNQSLYNSTMVNGLQELLRYADRNSMAHSREVRLPFLNHDLVEFLFTLPSDFKIRDGWTKWIMRESTTTILPKEIGWRKDKIGYEPPQKNWMENDKIKQKIAHNRSVLFDKQVLHKSMMNRSIEAEDSNVHTGHNWQIWVAGNMFS